MAFQFTTITSHLGPEYILDLAILILIPAAICDLKLRRKESVDLQRPGNSMTSDFSHPIANACPILSRVHAPIDLL